MRSICVALGVLLSSAPASADTSKAWQAAKDNLPPTTPAIAGFDVAAIVKLPAFGKLLDLVKKDARDVREGLELLKSACGLDPTKAVDGVVVAGDPNGRDDDVMLFLQLTIDRTKASACIESMLKAVEKRKQVTVKQNGIYSEVSVGGDTAFFAWVSPNVVAFNLDPGNKARLDGFLGKQGLARSPVGALLGKLDPKAVASGAIKTAKPLDRDVPVTSAYGNALLSGNTVSATVVGTATDAAAVTKLTDELNYELAKTIRRDRTPAVAKKIMRAIAITSAGNDVTIKGSANASELVDALVGMMMRKDPEPAMPARAADPPPPAKN